MSSLHSNKKHFTSDDCEMRQLDYEYKCIESDEETAILGERVYSSSQSRINFYEEPITHIRNQSFLRRIIFGCWSDKKYRLTRSELWSFCKLREDANVTFDPRCDDFNNLLGELYKLLTNDSLTDISNEKWKVFGFQNTNPRSDFRAGGLLSLLNLISFAKSYNNRIKFMAATSNEFLLAISSINITHFLVKYYHLSNIKQSPKLPHELCSRNALKSFCKILEEDSEVLERIHHMLLNDLYDVWQNIRKNVPGVTLLDFSMAQDVVKRKFKKITQTRSYDDFDSLSQAYLKACISIPGKRPSLSSRQ